MKWFQHQSKANRDTKLRKVLMRYGAEGYGLYWFCIEHICDSLEPRLTFELEHDSEILAHELKIDTLKVEEMMLYMVKLGLFEELNGVITCYKLACHLGDNLTRNEQLKTIIRDSKRRQKPDLSKTVSDSLRLSEVVTARGEEKRGEEKKKTRQRFTPPTLQEVSDYCAERGNSVDPAKFLNHYEANGWYRGKSKVKDWQACVRTWESNNSRPSSEEPAL